MDETSETARERLQNTLAWMQGVQRELLFSKELDSGIVTTVNTYSWAIELYIYNGEHKEIKSYWVSSSTSPEKVAALKERAIAFLKAHGIIIGK